MKYCPECPARGPCHAACVCLKGYRARPTVKGLDTKLPEENPEGLSVYDLLEKLPPIPELEPETGIVKKRPGRPRKVAADAV